jgi:hypothetical protein
MGRGSRSGKNQWDIREKHKNFGKIMICLEKDFVYLRKLREVRENFRMFYVCRQVFGISGKLFLVCPEKYFWSPLPPPRSLIILGRNIKV